MSILINLRYLRILYKGVQNPNFINSNLLNKFCYSETSVSSTFQPFMFPFRQKVSRDYEDLNVLIVVSLHSCR